MVTKNPENVNNILFMFENANDNGKLATAMKICQSYFFYVSFILLKLNIKKYMFHSFKLAPF